MKTSNTLVRLALVASLGVVALPTAQAANTAAGTDVTNTATVDYKVGGVSQTQKTSNAVTFKVDRKIDVVVAESGGSATQVTPGAASPATVLTYTVTNNSNSAQDFALAATQQSGGAAPFNGKTDNFDATGLQVFVEDGTTAGFQPAEDTATYVDELAAGASKTVYVVGSIPAGRVDGDAAVVILTATAHQSVDGTGAYVATAGSLAAAAAQSNTGVDDDPTYIDTVFGDGTGATDGARNGDYSAKDQYNVVTASIAITKSSRVISDPFNGTGDGLTIFPKAVPGSVIEYCLDVNNTGSANATSIVLTDAIPTNTTYAAASIRTAAVATGTTPATGCDAGGGTGSVSEDDDAAGADESNPDGADYNVTTAGSVTVITPTITAGSRFKAVFRVTVD